MAAVDGWIKLCRPQGRAAPRYIGAFVSRCAVSDFSDLFQPIIGVSKWNRQPVLLYKLKRLPKYYWSSYRICRLITDTIFINVINYFIISEIKTWSCVQKIPIKSLTITFLQRNLSDFQDYFFFMTLLYVWVNCSFKSFPASTVKRVIKFKLLVLNIIP